MTTLSAQEFVKILEGTRSVRDTKHKGYCTCSYSSSIIDSTLRTQTGIVPHTYGQKAVEEGREIKIPKKKSKDQEFKKQLKKYLNEA